ncbi:hypothetical protein Droror1_Dr00027302 [Drosera rotundifolia]
MDSAQPSAVTPSKSKLARAFAKVLHVRAGSEVAPFDGFHHTKSLEDRSDTKLQDHLNLKIDIGKGSRHKSAKNKNEDTYKNRVALEALLAKIFASVSSIKAAYAELQLAQFPYDVDGIQTCDLLVVAELKVISELKHCYLKKQLDASPEASLLSAEIKEQKCVSKAYKIMGKKMESSLKMKVSQITLLSEKLEETKRENRSLEKTLNSSGQLSTLDNFQLSGLNASHFIPVLRHAARSIRSFVKVMVNEMQLARWDLYAAVNTIQPEVQYWKEEHICFGFESFVSREMFDSFHYSNFSLPNESLPEKKNGLRQRLFFERFNELQSSRAKDYLVQNPKSTFSKFCRAQYLKIVHPKMESSFFGNLEQRNLISSGKFPSTHFFVSFMEMAKRVWLLHCLAFSFDPAGSIFGVERGCRFSEVHMESLADEAFITSSVVNKEPIVGFTVVPGFKIGKTVIQSQVYLSRP